MGREAKITYEQVAAAADAMCAANLRPSSRVLREKLGNTASMGTINRLLQGWKATQEHHQAPPVTARSPAAGDHGFHGARTIRRQVTTRIRNGGTAPRDDGSRNRERAPGCGY